MNSLKRKTISGITWSFIDNFSQKGITFIIGIILARLLLPSQFGLIGMISIFIAISTSFVNSGFSAALIRKKDCTDEDYSTVFYFNLAAGIIFYWILFFSAPVISRFFNEPQLNKLVRALSIILVIDSLTIIQRTVLTKRLNFKLQTKISLFSTIFGGIVGITMATAGYGVWSLVAKLLSQKGANSLFLWLWNKWQPSLVFNKKSFKELFSFGYKLLLSGLIDTIYRNAYYMVIGKYFSAKELGFFTRANQFKALPSQNIMIIIDRVSYPVLSEMQDDNEKLKTNYKKLIKATMLITFILMLGMAAISESMIITLIGEKWRQSIIYLQLLCFAGMMYPLHSINLNMLKVQGRTDLFLKIEVMKKILAIPVIIIGVIFGIKIMIAGMILNSFFAYFLNSYWSGKFLNYSLKEQVSDILPSFILAFIASMIVFLIGWILPFDYILKLIIQILTEIFIVIIFAEITRLDSYLFIKNIVQTKFEEGRNGQK